MNKKIAEATSLEISQVMKEGAISKIYKKRKAERFGYDEDIETGEIKIASKYAQKKADSENLGLEFRLYKSNARRKQKIREKVASMIKTNHAYFITLTFSEEFLARDTTEETRRRYITRFLKSETLEYIANLDYGKKNEREHYHAIVRIGKPIDFKKYQKIFKSNINAERIILKDTSVKLLSKYINKLTNHALKETGHAKRIIFSRETN